MPADPDRVCKVAPYRRCRCELEGRPLQLSLKHNRGCTEGRGHGRTAPLPYDRALDPSQLPTSPPQTETDTIIKPDSRGLLVISPIQLVPALRPHPARLRCSTPRNTAQ